MKETAENIAAKNAMHRDKMLPSQHDNDDSILRTICRKDVQDDGEVQWNEEIKKLKQIEGPDSIKAIVDVPGLSLGQETRGIGFCCFSIDI